MIVHRININHGSVEFALTAHDSGGQPITFEMRSFHPDRAFGSLSMHLRPDIARAIAAALVECAERADAPIRSPEQGASS